MRNIIVLTYLESGTPSSLLNIAKIVNLSESDLIKKLNDQKKLESIGDLRIHQAYELINYYGDGLLYSDEIEKSVKEFMEVNERIKNREKRLEK